MLFNGFLQEHRTMQELKSPRATGKADRINSGKFTEVSAQIEIGRLITSLLAITKYKALSYMIIRRCLTRQPCIAHIKDRRFGRQRSGFGTGHRKPFLSAFLPFSDLAGAGAIIERKKRKFMNSLIHLRKTAPLLATIPLLLTCMIIRSAPNAFGVLPAPDGGYPGENTAEGHDSLLSLTTGSFNTAVGWVSLRSNTTGALNTAVGAGTLLANTADQNTAIGAGTLLANTMGHHNTATGVLALYTNTSGNYNTANGDQALFFNATGSDNTAIGLKALYNNTSGVSNVAIGESALQGNTAGSLNCAIGNGALDNNTIGNSNIGVGFQAGFNQIGGSNNIYIGNFVGGVANEKDSCYIAGIFNQTAANGAPVVINSDNKLGTATSSKRFKDNIKPMDKASQALFALKPVSFRYKKQIDPAGAMQLGLVAEDVEKVNPDLVVRDKEGKPYTVRYDQVNAMLLNEFLKEHKAFVEQQQQVREQRAMIAQQQKQIETLAAGLQKISARLEVSKTASQTALNDR